MAALKDVEVEVSVTIDLNDHHVARAFDEWMRRFIESPSRFAREWEEVEEFKRDISMGKRPAYGQTAVAYLVKLIVEGESDLFTDSKKKG